MTNLFLPIAAGMQALAVAYGLVLLSRRQGAAGAWLFLLGAMLSMLVWRIVVMIEAQPPPFFNPLIAIWGSTCMLAAMFLFGQEVERRKRAEAERDALLESERAARNVAEHASRTKDDFLATLSHELRTPLAAILSWCAVARHARVGPEEKDKAIDTIERNARSQARLVDDLLDMTRLHAGALHLEFASVPLDVPVRAALQGVQPAAAAKGVSLVLEVASHVPVVKGDAGRLQQAAANLLVNAVKFTPPGGRITVTVNATETQARLIVADTGEGVDPAFLPQLFTRFTQADSTTARRHGGLGLGLSIVANLVRLHGGDVRAASAGRGRGSTFTITLPCIGAANAAAETPISAPLAANLSTALSGLRLLVIDDEQDVRDAVCRLLQQCGAEAAALDGGATIEATIAAFRPDVLIIDIGMPREDGYSLIRRIRNLPAGGGGDIPAISLTAHARDEDRSRALSAGFLDHLPKPIDLAALIAAVRRAALATGKSTTFATDQQTVAGTMA